MARRAVGPAPCRYGSWSRRGPDGAPVSDGVMTRRDDVMLVQAGLPVPGVASATEAQPRAVDLRDGVGDDERVVIACQRALLDLHAAAPARCDPVDDVP